MASDCPQVTAEDAERPLFAGVDLGGQDRHGSAPLVIQGNRRAILRQGENWRESGVYAL